MPKGGSRIGAGRPGRHLKVDDCLRLDVRDLQRDGLLTRHWVGAWQWRNSKTMEPTSSIGLTTCASQVHLSYRVDGEQVSELVQLDRTSCHLGGTRAWFRCPGCDRRVAVLLLRNQRFRCRRCQDLPYRSQSEDAIGRAWRGQVKLERRLGPNWSQPKGMHRTTRSRLMKRIFELENRREDLIEAVLDIWMPGGLV